jgi:hypothetical protein
MKNISIREKLRYLMKTEGITKIIGSDIEITPKNLDIVSEENLNSALSDIENLYEQSYGKEVSYAGLGETNSFKNPNFHMFLG